MSYEIVCLCGIDVFQRLKHWETRERKKLKEYEREKMKDDEKQEEMVLIFQTLFPFMHKLTVALTLVEFYEL